jgi:hypothetical protein
MTTDQSEVENPSEGPTRRGVLRGASTLLAGGVASAYLLTEAVQPALAVSNPEFAVNDAATVSTSDGRISSVTLEDGAGIDVAWEDFDGSATTVTIGFEVKLSTGSTYEQVLTGTVDTNPTASGSANYTWTEAFSQTSVDLISTASNIAASDFRSSTDGETETTDIDVKITADATVGGTAVSAENIATGAVSVENLPADVGVGGDVNLAASE